MVIKVLGYTLWVEAGRMVLPLLVAVYYQEPCWESFLYAAGLCAAAGIACSRVPARKREMQGRLHLGGSGVGGAVRVRGSAV